MALPVREHRAPLSRIHEEIDRMFQDFPFPNFWPTRDGEVRIPTVDLYEKNGSVIVEAELPGVDKKDIQISYTDSTITIQGHTEKQQDEKKEGYFRSERQYGSYHRTIPLPQPVDFAQAKAEFKHGVLTITLPKQAKPEAETRSIPISE